MPAGLIAFCLFLYWVPLKHTAVPGGLKKTEMGALDGNRTDQYNLAVYYLHEARGDLAFQWFEKAANKGHARAQHNLGVLYQQGVGTERDFQKARHWLERAAKQGLADAQLEMGILNFWGRGLAKNPTEAAKWFRMAARQGQASALSSLGNLYFRGQGHEKDSTKALAYYRMGMLGGDPKARRWVEYLQTQLDEKQQAEAKRLAKGDFRDLRWGMPMERFSKGQEYRIEKRGEDQIIGLETSFSGKYYFMEWIFKKDVLSKIELMQNFPDLDDEYDALKRRLASLYGDPEKDGYGSEEGVTREFIWLVPGLFEKTRVKIQKTESPTLFGAMKKKGLRIIYEPENPQFLEAYIPVIESEPSTQETTSESDSKSTTK